MGRTDAGARWAVLLAEDDDDHALLIEMALGRATSAAVQVHRARTGDEAIDLVDRVRPDLVLLDLHMPGRSGHEVLQAIKGDDGSRRIPVAVLTASRSDEDVARSYGLGGNHFITKPTNPGDLERQLRTLLKNLAELRGVRRGAGQIHGAAVSAVDPAALMLRRTVLWTAFVVVLVLLAALAYGSGALD